MEAARPQLFISLSGEPFRADPGQPYPSIVWFTRADTDHDGRLDRAEARADATAFFHRLDVNHDGVIDSFEAGDYEQKVAPEILGAYIGDASADGGSSASSSGGGGSSGRGRGGHGGRNRQNATTAATGAAPGGGFEGAAPFELTPDPEPVMSADLDLSGRITLDEFLRAVDRRFDALDKAHTGAIAFADLPKTPVQLLALGKGKAKGQGQGKGP